jgi:alpha-mannosidase
MLKVQFHTTVVAREATYDIAFGNIKRSTYANNSYDAARFEVPAHLWMDMSQTDFGLSLLNDCKYGHQGKENMMCLTLLRSPKNPDPESDMETHSFTYSLYPHAGSFTTGGTHREALDLNDPVDAVFGPDSAAGGGSRHGRLSSRHSFMELECEGATVEALKKAEDSDDIVVRVVERHGAQSEVRLSFAARPVRAVECDLMENPMHDVRLDRGTLAFTIYPYEIRTFKLGL